MEFNNYWTKEINKLYHDMIKEGKTMDEIKNHFGKDLLMHHPNKKFGDGYINKSFVNFIKEEIKVTPIDTYYKISRKNSSVDNNKKDYKISFIVNDNEYILFLYYFINDDKKSYEIFFTTKEQEDKKIEYLSKITKGELNEEEMDDIINIVEEETNRMDIMKLMKSLSYILFQSYPNIKYDNGDIPYSITESTKKNKMKLYRNIIENSFDNVIETEDILKDGRKIFYYKIIKL